MDRDSAATISPLEMIGLAEMCERAGDRSFAVLMVECAMLILSSAGGYGTAGAANTSSGSTFRTRSSGRTGCCRKDP